MLYFILLHLKNCNSVIFLKEPIQKDYFGNINFLDYDSYFFKKNLNSIS